MELLLVCFDDCCALDGRDQFIKQVDIHEFDIIDSHHSITVNDKQRMLMIANHRTCLGSLCSNITLSLAYVAQESNVCEVYLKIHPQL